MVSQKNVEQILAQYADSNIIPRITALENELKFISYDKTDVIDYCSEVEDILNNQEETEVVAIKKKF